jgi:hypothetical protein
MISVRAALFVLLFAGISSQALAEDVVVGTVKAAHGNVTIHRGQDDIAAKEGAHVLLDDALRTASGAGLSVILQDGTRLSLGPNTELKVDRFVYQPSEGRFDLLLNVLHGAMAYVSGKIAQLSPGSVSVQTPVGVLGLRGTRFALSLEGN